MTQKSDTDFENAVMAFAKPEGEPFTPAAYYDRDGDCIEFIAAPDAFFGERVDDLVTVYYSRDTGEIVGSLIKGISALCNRMLKDLPGFGIEIHDGRVKLRHLFRAQLWTSEATDPSDIRVIKYRKLIEVAERSDVDAEVCVAA